ncbi:MAG: NAD(P)/FAD-dependent oxidoreductase [Syntrophomonadaceae bacterium]|nr:NAD(P)/FAD-dependent oxidoreductase [Syntrophomonadaceae bacterium]
MIIAVIGNGAAGYVAAETIKRHKPEAEVMMFARESYPLYSPCALPDCLGGDLERARLFLKKAEDYRSNGIETIFGQTVEKIDVKERLVITDQAVYHYDRVIMATGSKAVIPPIPGARLPGTFTLKSLDDLDSMLNYKPQRVIVVGSGNIGMEAAGAMRDRGFRVTMIEAQDHVMPRLFDKKPAHMLQNMLEQTGIRVITGEQVQTMDGRTRVEVVETDRSILECDMLIWAVGLSPECSLARESGIEVGPTRGIKVDRHMQTNAAGVYACGDCAEAFDIITGHPVNSMLWPSARRQAQVAALNCIGIETEYEGAFNIVVGEVKDRPFAALGNKEDIHAGPIRIIEGEHGDDYWRILVADQTLIGMQSIGDLKLCGTVGGLIRNRTSLQELRETLKDPGLKMTSPWAAEAAQRYLAGF